MRFTYAQVWILVLTIHLVIPLFASYGHGERTTTPR